MFRKGKVEDWQVTYKRKYSFAYFYVFVAGRPSCRKKAIPGSCRIFKREKGYIKTWLHCEGNASVLLAHDKLSALFIQSVLQHT